MAVRLSKAGDREAHRMYSQDVEFSHFPSKTLTNASSTAQHFIPAWYETDTKQTPCFFKLIFGIGETFASLKSLCPVHLFYRGH